MSKSTDKLIEIIANNTLRIKNCCNPKLKSGVNTCRECKKRYSLIQWACIETAVEVTNKRIKETGLNIEPVQHDDFVFVTALGGNVFGGTVVHVKTQAEVRVYGAWSDFKDGKFNNPS